MKKTSGHGRLERLKTWLASLSFATGARIMALCALFYILSFASFALPVSYATKGILWTIFFGLAKTAQYSGLLILGKAGIARLKSRFIKKA